VLTQAKVVDTVRGIFFTIGLAYFLDKQTQGEVELIWSALHDVRLEQPHPVTNQAHII
jgi:hypothetical protein